MTIFFYCFTGQWTSSWWHLSPQLHSHRKIRTILSFFLFCPLIGYCLQVKDAVDVAMNGMDEFTLDYMHGGEPVKSPKW